MGSIRSFVNLLLSAYFYFKHSLHHHSLSKFSFDFPVIELASILCPKQIDGLSFVCYCMYSRMGRSVCCSSSKRFFTHPIFDVSQTLWPVWTVAGHHRLAWVRIDTDWPLSREYIQFYCSLSLQGHNAHPTRIWELVRSFKLNNVRQSLNSDADHWSEFRSRGIEIPSRWSFDCGSNKYRGQ